jgi:hypothetical protein
MVPSAAAAVSQVVYVDVDDTLIRTFGTKRIPIARVIEYVRRQHANGACLHLWSRGGASYAREVAVELGIDGLFQSFLSKPDVVLDDQCAEVLAYCKFLHPNEV